VCLSGSLFACFKYGKVAVEGKSRNFRERFQHTITPTFSINSPMRMSFSTFFFYSFTTIGTSVSSVSHSLIARERLIALNSLSLSTVYNNRLLAL
jgi:hypothetical protein